MNSHKLLLALLLMAPLAAGCGDDTGQDAAPRTDSTEVTQGTTPLPSEPLQVKVGIIPIAEVAPIYVGIEKGYFESEGLKLDLVRMAGGANILPAVSRGELHVGFTNLVSLALFRTRREGGGELAALVGGTYETSENLNHALIVPAGADTSPGAIARARIAVNTRNNVEELMLRRWLRGSGAAADNLELQAIPFPAMEAALRRGNVGAVSIVEPFITNLTSQGFRVASRQYLASPGDTVIVATYAASAAWMRDNADVAARFRRAFTRATEFLNDPIHETEVRSIIARHTSTDAEVATRMGLPLMLDCVKPSSLDALLGEMRDGAMLDRPLTADSLLAEGTPRCGGR